MLRSISPNISIITNFGCHANCWYCIWKGHELEHCKDKTNWAKLDQFLKEWSGKRRWKVSVSGGGDCLYNFEKHRYFWSFMFDRAKKYGLAIDIHTRQKFYNTAFWWQVNMCVFSSDNLSQDREYLEDYLTEFTRLRITHLVTEHTTDKMIEEYLNFSGMDNYQFTIKELVGFDDRGRYKEIRKRYPEIFFLDKGDYNLYYMPDNSVRERFL